MVRLRRRDRLAGLLALRLSRRLDSAAEQRPHPGRRVVGGQRDVGVLLPTNHLDWTARGSCLEYRADRAERVDLRTVTKARSGRGRRAGERHARGMGTLPMGLHPRPRRKRAPVQQLRPMAESALRQGDHRAGIHRSTPESVRARADSRTCRSCFPGTVRSIPRAQWSSRTPIRTSTPPRPNLLCSTRLCATSAPGIVSTGRQGAGVYINLNQALELGRMSPRSWSGPGVVGQREYSSYQEKAS